MKAALGLEILFSLVVLVCITFYASQRLRGSPLYFHSVGELKRMETERRDQALSVIQRLREKQVAGANIGERSGKAAPVPSLCIAVLSVARVRSYLLESVTSVLEQGLDDNVDLFVYNADPMREHTTRKTGPQVDNDLDLLRSVGVRVVDAKMDAHECMRKLGCHPLKKETLDYASVLQECLNTGAGYLVVLQDDALVADDFVGKLRKLAKRMEWKYRGERRLRGFLSPRADDWIAVKLFVTDFWSGWEYKFSDLAIQLVCSVTFGSCFLLLRRNPKKRFSCRSDAMVLVYSSLWFGLVLFVLGKQNTPFSPWWFEGVFEMESRLGASAVGQMYSRQTAPRLLEYLNNYNFAKRIVGVDILIEEMARKSGMGYYVVLPNLVEHLGVHSSIGFKESRRKLHWEEDEFYRNYKRSAWFPEKRNWTK